MNRRAFLGVMGGLPFAGSQAENLLSADGLTQRFESYFPTAAHQLVWRNWDLVPLERIAAALSCSPATVEALAKTMALEPQPPPQQYGSRLRFKALRRNWDFVPFSQLTILLGMSREEISQLLHQDAFYISNLGPNPECKTIRIEGGDVSSRLLPQFSPVGQYRPAEERFAFIATLDRPISEPSKGSLKRETALLPRIIFPYFAPFGEVLRDNEFKSYYTAGVLENIARMGLDSIWLEAVLHDVVKSNTFPEFGRESALQLERLNWIIAEAKRAGLGVFLYLNEPRGMPAGFFRKYPEIKGAPGRPGDGLFSMCTSTKPVQDFLLESADSLFKKAPGLEGSFLITASENPTNCYSLTRHPDCPRCKLRSGPEVLAQVIDLIQQGAHQANPAARIIAWDWSWGIVEDDPQREIIARLPEKVTLMVDFARGAVITREGVKSVADEYSLSVSGPSPRAEAHIRQAHARGMNVMAKVQVGNTWELGLLPYIPVEQLVVRKFEAMRSSGISGAMESWTLGGYPSQNWEVAEAFYRKVVPDSGEVLESAAASLYGTEAAPKVVSAWRAFSEAFQHYPFSNGLVYSSVVQCGPAHLIYFEPTGKAARILNSYDDLSWTRPFGPQVVANVFERMASGWQRGVVLLEEALKDVPAAKQLQAMRDFRISQAALLYFKSIANQVRFNSSRQNWKKSHTGLNAMTGLVRDEIRLAEQFLEICTGDSRVGFEASLEYFYLPLDIREKLAACRFMLEKQIPEARRRLSA
ncbi:MAG: hypothetical protein KGM47_17435 [Acidobacteriota bacterium]|nr:hypothetical protein [Acidobacteriota bacterium]